jgi:hypothetical protein
MVVRCCSSRKVSLLGELRSHTWALTLANLERRQRFFLSASVSPSAKGGKREGGIRRDRSMTNSPLIELDSFKRARKLVGFVLNVAWVGEVLEFNPALDPG